MGSGSSPATSIPKEGARLSANLDCCGVDAAKKYSPGKSEGDKGGCARETGRMGIFFVVVACSPFLLNTEAVITYEISY